jgi:hypothetical protein
VAQGAPGSALGGGAYEPWQAIALGAAIAPSTAVAARPRRIEDILMGESP